MTKNKIDNWKLVEHIYTVRKRAKGITGTKDKKLEYQKEHSHNLGVIYVDEKLIGKKVKLMIRYENECIVTDSSEIREDDGRS